MRAGLEMTIVMILQTIWNVITMVEIAVETLSIIPTVLNVNVLK